MRVLGVALLVAIASVPATQSFGLGLPVLCSRSARPCVRPTRMSTSAGDMFWMMSNPTPLRDQAGPGKKSREFLAMWDAAKANQKLPSSGTEGWRADLLDRSADLLHVEDFLDVAVNTIRDNGGSMLASELVKTLDAREGDRGGIDSDGTWMERKLTGTTIVLRDVIRQCTRLELSETGDVLDPRISLFLDEGAVNALQGTVLLDTRQSRGVSAVRGSLKSVLDFAVEEVLEDAGYKPSDRVVLYDGACNLCNNAVNFILDHDVEETFRFAALQSEAGHALLRKGGRDPNDMSTMVLVDKGIVYDRSDAVLRIGQSLNLPANGQWAALAARIAVPKPIRDWFYSDVISANRRKWFGESDECRFMDDELEKRFLS